MAKHNHLHYHKSEKKQLLISFMGMGELVLNPNAIEILKHLKQFCERNLGYWDVSFAMATMMPDKLKFEQFMTDIVHSRIPLKVHFSMHTPFDSGRFNLLPATKVTITETMKMLELYRGLIHHLDEM